MRILIAEDEPVARLVLVRSLRELGYDPLVATSGDEAWRLARSEPIDVLISDVIMPGLSGMELCQQIRKAGGPYVYFMLVTSLEQPESRREGVATTLIRHAEEWFKKRKLPYVVYNTAEDNQPIIDLFARFGCEVTERESEMVQLKRVLSPVHLL